MLLSDENKKQLRRLSVENIKEFAQSKGLIIKERSKEDVIESLQFGLKDDDLNSLEEFIQKYRFTGKGPLHFFNVQIEDHFELDKKDTTEAVLTKICGHSPFENRLRPVVSEKPQIIYAEYISSNRLLIETAHEGSTRITANGWEEVEITPTVIIRSIIHIDKGIMQVHSPNSSSTAVAVVVADALRLTKLNGLKFNQDEINKLKSALNAISVGSDLKRNAGEIDMTKHRGRGISDLDSDPEYQTESVGKVVRKKILQFQIQGETTKIELTVGKGTITFKTLTGERVVDHVLSKVREIKSIPQPIS